MSQEYFIFRPLSAGRLTGSCLSSLLAPPLSAPLLLAVTLALAAGAAEDPIRALQLDQASAARFAAKVGASVLVLDGELAAPDWADQRIARPKVSGLAVVIEHPEYGRRVLTGGMLGAALGRATLRIRGGEAVRVESAVPLGDGGLYELRVSSPALKSLVGLPISSLSELKRGLPVMSVGGIETEQPMLFYGSVLERLSGPLAHVITTDIRFPHGAPLVSAAGDLLGITFRNHPNDDSIGWAIGADTINAWLRPKDSASDSREKAPRAR